MESAGYTIDGGYPVWRDLQIAATVVVGQPVLGTSTAGDASAYVTDPTTTSLADMAGLVLAVSPSPPTLPGVTASLTASNTQGDAEQYARVFISPGLVIKALASGGATEGTALTRYTNTSANAAGTTFTAALGTATMDGGLCYFTAGNNTGRVRRITTFTASTSFVVTKPVPNTISTSDVVIVVPWRPAMIGASSNVQLSTLFTQVDASIAVGTGAEAMPVDIEFDPNSPTTNTYLFWVALDHVFSGRLS